MSEIRVDLDALQSGQAGISKTFQRLQSTLNDLEVGLRPMIQTWSGSAQDQYLLCKRQWDDAAQELGSVLDRVATAVGLAHENYSSANDQTVKIWT